jgi:hypothetical protein
MALPHVWPVNGLMPLTLTPPFRSSRLCMSYLPLRASLDQLTRFCDAYLNFGRDLGLPAEVGVFRPRVPLVYLIVAAHPRLESLTDQVYLVQHELAFSIPVEIHRRERERWHFVGYAFAQPFIFIDSPLGMTTGRLVWGWPKARATFEATAGWAEGRGPLRMSLPELEGRPLITIRRDPEPGCDHPMGGSWGMASGAWTTLATNYASMMRELVAPWLDPRGALDRMAVLWRQLARLPGVTLDIVTLKQFPWSDTRRVTHQAIVHSSAKVTRVHEVSLLGAGHQALGALSGGLRVDIGRDDLYPIAELLGLEPERTSTSSDGRAIGTFEPVMPFRAIIDAEYDAGRGLCQRGYVGPWYRGYANPDVTPDPFHDPETTTDHDYVTAQGPASRIPEHPRTLPGLRLCVYPLATHPNPERLRQLCSDCLALEASRYQLQITEPYVYLVTAQARPLGFVSLCVPVSITETDEANQAGTSHRAVVIPFEHASTGREAISFMEYAGRRTMPAELRWYEAAEDGLRFALRAELAPVLGGGRRAEFLPVLEIFASPAPGERSPHDGPSWWRERAPTHPFEATVLALAQFPSARFVRRACVQARFAMTHTLEPKPGTREPIPAARVRFHDYASQSLVEVFDLANTVAVAPGVRAADAYSPWSEVIDLGLSRREHWPAGITPG